jgi:hypothetical protein
MSIKERIKLIFSPAVEFLAPFIRLFLGSEGHVLASIALDVVKELMTLYAIGEEKQRIAAMKIRAALKIKGIEVRPSVINAAIEVAYQKLKAQNGNTQR